MTNKKGQPKSNMNPNSNPAGLPGPIAIKQIKDEPRVDSRFITDQLGVQHHSTMRLERYRSVGGDDG